SEKRCSSPTAASVAPPSCKSPPTGARASPSNSILPHPSLPPPRTPRASTSSPRSPNPTPAATSRPPHRPCAPSFPAAWQTAGAHSTHAKIQATPNSEISPTPYSPKWNANSTPGASSPPAPKATTKPRSLPEASTLPPSTPAPCRAAKSPASTSSAKSSTSPDGSADITFNGHGPPASAPANPHNRTHCTIRISPTLRVSPALVPETTRLYVPLGVGLPVVPPPPELVPGISREAPHPASTITQHRIATTPSRRSRLRPRPSSPIGSSPASHTICLSPGQCRAAPATLVATVTVIVDVAPSAGEDGFTVQVECAGTGPHESATDRK